MTISRRTFGVGSAATVAGLALGSRAEAQGLAKEAEAALYEAAKKEGQLTYYTAHYAIEHAEGFGRAFTAKYPGVKCNVVRTTAQVAYQRLNQELKAGGPQCDVFASTDISHCLELKSKGLLERSTPANAKTMLASLQDVDPEGYFHTTSIGVVAITYNSSKVKAGDVPRKWTDLTDPKWKNQVSVGHPAFSGYVGIWVWQMMSLYGWDYFEKLKGNNPQIGRSIQDTLTHLRSGERSVASGAVQTAFESKLKGEPIDVAYPEDGTVIIIAPSAIVKGVKNPNAAKLFLEFMTSREASELSASYFIESNHAGIKPKAGKPLSEVKTLVAPADKLLKGIADVKERWRDTFGV